MKPLTALIAAATVATTWTLSAGIAHAGTTSNGASLIVEYPAKDLNNSRGIATLYRKIKGAAEAVCVDYRLGLSTAPDKACVTSTIGRTLESLHRPELNAFAAAHGVFVGSLASSMRGR